MITRILEQKSKFTVLLKDLIGPRGIKTEVNALCSCKKEYKIKEKFDFRNQTATRKAECPYCKDITYLTYNVTAEDHSNGFDGYYGGSVAISLSLLS